MKKILFVDDEPNVLSAIQRQLHSIYKVETAPGPAEGLEALKNWRDYSVVVADMSMPEMNGVEFLSKVKELAPDIVRVMLTGYADQATVTEAINQGSIFRFLSKPCPTEQLIETLEACVRQNQLITAERELLEKTVGGSLKVLTELLAMTDPRRFGNAESLRDNIRLLAERLGVKVTWDLEAAAMLSQIGTVTIPPEVTLKMRLGHALSNNEKEILSRIPAIGSSLLANIPRLEEVAKIILYQNKQFDGRGFPDDNVAGEDIPLGARMLKVLWDLAQLEAKGLNRAIALQQLRAREGWYDPEILSAVMETAAVQEPSSVPDSKVILAVKFSHLRVGQVLQTDVETKTGVLLVPNGTRMTPMVLHWLRNFAALYGIKEPILVSNSPSEAAAEASDTRWAKRPAPVAPAPRPQNAPS
jgi:response regulator RpfG family c-di-GMP phosphodiesterase